MAEGLHQFVRVDFRRFKAFESFSFNLRHFNILVGPNNAGKSTILTAFRILAAALRRAKAKSPDRVPAPQGRGLGYAIDLSAVSVAEENIFYNYEDHEPATVKFSLSNGNQLLLYFPERGACYLIPEASNEVIRTPSNFRANFNCAVGFVPILGPVEHHEGLFEKEAARLALFNYRAARNFRNIWYHYPEKFQEFRDSLKRTWPGMDIERPRVELFKQKPVLRMFCPEDRIPREIFWAGFGFQVWCQMLTHIIQSSDDALFLIDEPDIYLHSDLQRQLLGLLRNMGPDILIATHSTEIITEAETDDIVLVNKQRRTATRIRNPSQLEEVFRLLGSNLNPILTQLAKTRRAIFVEGKDFQVISKFAQKLRRPKVGNRSEFAVIPVEAFSPERIRSLKLGMEMTLGGKILAAAVLDKDYRSKSECNAIKSQCMSFCDAVVIHNRKEMENFLLVPSAIDRAAKRRLIDRKARTNSKEEYESTAEEILDKFAARKRSYVVAQYISCRRNFERAKSSKLDESKIAESVIEEVERVWESLASRLDIVPGKEALSAINDQLQKQYKVSITATAIVDAMRADEIPEEMKRLVESIDSFAMLKIGSNIGDE